MWSTSYQFSPRPIINIIFSFTNNYLLHQQYVKFSVKNLISLTILLFTIVTSILWFLVDNLFLMIYVFNFKKDCLVLLLVSSLLKKFCLAIYKKSCIQKLMEEPKHRVSYHYLPAHQLDCISGSSSRCKLATSFHKQ